MIARRTRAQKLAEMLAPGAGSLPTAPSSGDPRTRRYTQQAATPSMQFSPDDFYIDSDGRLALGDSEVEMSSLASRRHVR
jgi:hypothetical protein